MNFLFFIAIVITIIISYGIINLLKIQDNEKIIAYAQPEPDQDGVMMYDYNGVQRKTYNPLIISTYGLSYYDKYTKNIDKDHNKRNFINTANWILNNSKNYDEYSILEYNFPWMFYGGIEPPYASSLAQAKGMYLLILAYEITNDEKYYKKAEKIANSFKVEYDDGGVVSKEDNNNSLFLHLLAKPHTQKLYVLNGHTNTLIFLWKYYEKTNDQDTKIVFNKGINYLKENLLKYDSGIWSYYDLMGNKAQMSYHKGQIKQLEILYNISNEEIIKKYADRFTKYLKYAPSEYYNN